MIVCADGFSFDFQNALDAFVFDEEDKSEPRYHGLPMKRVDVMAEFHDRYIYVEVKDIGTPKKYKEPSRGGVGAKSGELDRFSALKEELKHKYRDSYLFRQAEGKVDKPIHYICLLGLDNAQCGVMRDALSKELPLGRAHSLWKDAIVHRCEVFNLRGWNSVHSDMPVTKL